MANTRNNASSVDQSASTQRIASYDTNIQAQARVDNVGWEKLQMSGMRFKSVTFAIYPRIDATDPDRNPFMAHQTVLSRSPVLRMLCESDCKESQSLEIRLPDESAVEVAHLLQYLYTNDFDASPSPPYYRAPTLPLVVGSSSDGHHHHNHSSPSDTAHELAGMYRVGDKYDLDGLKILALRKIKTLPGFPEFPVDFFKVTRSLYENVPESDKYLREYFVAEAPKYMPSVTKEEKEWLMEQLSGGGVWACDYFTASEAANVEARARLKRERDEAKSAAASWIAQQAPPPKKRAGRGGSTHGCTGGRS